MQSKRYRAIFISDFHIGAKTLNADSLLDFLKKTESDTLYLVGDIIDGWKLQKRWLWNETISRVLDELVRKSQEGTQVIYLPGNHDDTVRLASMFKRMRFARRTGVKITNSIIHKTANGRKFLVMHGDQFDTKILSEPVLKAHHKLSDWLGGVMTSFRPEPAYIQINGETKRFSLAKYLSKHGRIAIQTLNDFEGLIYKKVKAQHADGIICGHTHIPALKKIKDITYANTGSWLRAGNTAIVEDYNGELALLDWDEQAQTQTTPANQYAMPFYGEYCPSVSIQPDAGRYRIMTDFIIKKIKVLWHNGGEYQAPSVPSRFTFAGSCLKQAQSRLGASITLPLQGSIPHVYTPQPLTL